MPLDVIHCGIDGVEYQRIQESAGGANARDDVMEVTMHLRVWMMSSSIIDLRTLERCFREALMGSLKPTPKGIKTISGRSLIIERE